MRFLPIALALALATATTSVDACSRIVASTANATAVTAVRSMDWPEEQPTIPDIFALPAGLDRAGAAGPDGLKWTSKYGSVCTGFLGLKDACVDGVNTAGLSAALLYLQDASMATPQDVAAGGLAAPALNITMWASQALDNYGSVAEALAALTASPPPYILSTFTLPGGRLALGHMMLTDKTGASAVVEPVDGGRLRAFTHGPGGGPVVAMTNGPTYDAMLAAAEALPAGAVPKASDESVDRFQRATFWRARATVPADPPSATAVARSLIRAVATPLGTGATSPEAPDISPTQWTSAVDLKRGLYILEPAGSLAATVVPLDALGLDDPATPVRVLATGTHQDKYAGVVAASDFKEAAATASKASTTS